MRHQKFFLIAASTAALTCSQSALAAGFAVSAQSAYGMGNAYAGNAAVASDASTVLTNPAGMLELDAPVFSMAAALTSTSADYTDQGSLTSPIFESQPASGDTSANLSGTPITPNLFYSRKLSNEWAIGLGINVPFATSSSYDESWVGRYHAVDTAVTAIDINPTVAYRINDKVSIGGGISIQRATALLTNKIDSGATCNLVALQAGAPDGTCASFGLTENNPNTDSNVELDGDGTELTFNLGVLIKPKAGTKIGIAYRHGAQHELEGNADFDINAGLAGLIASGSSTFLTDTGSSVSADLPATLDFSIAQKVHSKVQLLGSLKWTQWSSFDALTTTFDNLEQPESALPFAWEDTVTASAGLNYAFNNKLTLRAGFAYDQSPIPNPTARSPRGAANDRYWYSAGGTYSFSKKISASFAATHIQIDQSAIDNTGTSTGASTLRGTYDFDVNLLAVQFSWHFI